MKYVTIYTENSHYEELLQVANNFKYTEKIETGEQDLAEDMLDELAIEELMKEVEKDLDENDDKEEILANVREGFEEMILIQQGKMKGTPAREFLKELREEMEEERNEL
jgi:hypothetical protein